MIGADLLPFFSTNDDVESDRSDRQRASWYSANSLLAPRSAYRVEYEEHICLTGLDNDFQDCSTPVLVRGRDISVDGVSFNHLRPMPFRFVRMLVPAPNGPEALTVRLTWCRYASHGEYVSGGYFLRQVDAGPGEDLDWDTLDEG